MAGNAGLPSIAATIRNLYKGTAAPTESLEKSILDSLKK